MRALRASPVSPLAAGSGAAFREPPRAHSAWTTGFLTNALNPKAALCIIAFFATLISGRTPLAVKMVYGLWISLSTMAWFALVAAVFTRERMRRTYFRSSRWIDRALGAVFLVLAASLVATSLYR